MGKKGKKQEKHLINHLFKKVIQSKMWFVVNSSLKCRPELGQKYLSCVLTFQLPCELQWIVNFIIYKKNNKKNTFISIHHTSYLETKTKAVEIKWRE